MKTRAMWLLVAGLGAPGAAEAAIYPEHVTPGTFLGVEIRVDNDETPLYRAVDGSGRYYFEARSASEYEIVLTNRTGRRLGADVDVDGLNVVSGERDQPSVPGRMYILDPWQSTTIRGWRTSLQDVRRFTFVDEKRSYAARSGKANEKMGWVEIAVYRERRAYIERPPYVRGPVVPYDDNDAPRAHGEAPERTHTPEASTDTAGEMKAAPASPSGVGRRESYPGTGWGERTEDRVHVVSFDFDPTPVQSLTLRYEYTSGLRALGIVPDSWYGRNRLRDRDRGRSGFAQPPGRR